MMNRDVKRIYINMLKSNSDLNNKYFAELGVTLLILELDKWTDGMVDIEEESK